MELNSDAREVKGNLYCLRCHDKMGIPVCGACHRPIEERVVTALGKHWHVEHFVCAKCEKPFLGHRHYEKKVALQVSYQLTSNYIYLCAFYDNRDWLTVRLTTISYLETYVLSAIR